MKRIHLIFGCHSHQPIGNFDFVFEEAYRKSYLPFIDVLERFPAVHVTLHYTGPLWDWFLAHAPDYVGRIAALARAGQVEIMGGGYYEPLLCAIPERDAIAQIARMQGFCREHLGVSPRGMWLTERVWEPRMASVLARAGIEYTALDDSHFTCSGVSADRLLGYHMTEDEGLPLKVFPILHQLRYLVPFHPVQETIELLRGLASDDGEVCAVLHDDGEKFGVWPGTFHSVYEEGWLEEFFQALTEHREWLHSVTYSEFLGKARALGRVYITCASYFEMMAWVLPTPMHRDLQEVEREIKALAREEPARAERLRQFVHGGFWRGFLAKYEEANNIQKRMLRTSARLARLKAGGARGPQLAAAEKLLHEGQCNCAYWHGVFGGLYLNHLRTALYQKLIEADRVMDEIEGRDAAWCAAAQGDFDGDGNDEVTLENDRIALFLSPADGGTLFELDHKPRPFNFLNTLARREEVYHDALRLGAVQVGEAGGGSIHDLVQAKEAGLENLLIYDAWRRASLRDHLFDPSTTLDGLVRGGARELAALPTGPFEIASLSGNGAASVTLRRQIRLEADGAGFVILEKTVALAPGASRVEIRYDVRCDGAHPVEVLFGVEFGVNLLTGSTPDRYYESENRDLGRPMLGAAACDEGLAHLALKDEWQRIAFSLRCDEAARFFRFPIETVSQSEAGQERVYQGSVVVPCWPVVLSAASPIRRTLVVELEQF